MLDVNERRKLAGNREGPGSFVGVRIKSVARV
jgi:hypothetical protein